MINVTIGNKPEKQSKGYPKLMKGLSGAIYLMVRDSEGIIITGADIATGVKIENQIPMNYLTDFNEPLTLQNGDE